MRARSVQILALRDGVLWTRFIFVNLDVEHDAGASRMRQGVHHNRGRDWRDQGHRHSGARS